MKTTKVCFTKYDEFILDGKGKSIMPFTLRGFSDEQRVVVRDCVFDIPLVGLQCNPSDLDIIRPAMLI